MSITCKDNRTVIVCEIREKDAAYAYIRDNGLQTVTTLVEGGELTVTARPKEGSEKP